MGCANRVPQEQSFPPVQLPRRREGRRCCTVREHEAPSSILNPTVLLAPGIFALAESDIGTGRDFDWIVVAALARAWTALSSFITLMRAKKLARRSLEVWLRSPQPA